MKNDGHLQKIKIVYQELQSCRDEKKFIKKYKSDNHRNKLKNQKNSKYHKK